MHSHHLHLLELAPPTNSGRNEWRSNAPRFPFMTIQENVPLAPFTTFRIGGAARFFVRAKTVDEVREAVTFAQGKKVFILGGGSNLLISDAGFDGVVIKNEIAGIVEEKMSDEENFTRIIAGAGENWDNLIDYVVKKGLYGLENLSLIPGTVGASPVQNIGAYGVEAKDLIDWVEVYNPESSKVEQLKNADCQFGYRDSIFKHKRKNNIILRVAFLLQKTGAVNIEYKDLKNYFAEKGIGSAKVLPTLQSVRKAVIEIRTKKLPDLAKVGTAGSFFKNAVITKIEAESLVKKYPELPVFQTDGDNVKVPTAWILDKICGFKGLRKGNVGVYENQALVLVNFGGGTAQEIKNLAQEMIVSVKQKTGITISPEVEFV